MSVFRCWSCWRLWAGVLLALWAGGVLAPCAQAGCDSDVVVIRPAGGTSHSSEFDSSLHSSPNPSSDHSMPGPRPCSGPHCSRSPVAPPAPPATTIDPSQEWACLSVLPDGADRRGCAHLLEDNLLKPIFRSYRIYHPPR